MDSPDWEVMYDDGSVFSSLDGPYWMAPRTGVQAVLQADEATGIKTLHSPDGWWFWKKGRWFGATREGKDDYRRTHMSPELCILEGRWVTDEEWAGITAKIREHKSAWYRYERRVTDG